MLLSRRNNHKLIPDDLRTQYSDANHDIKKRLDQWYSTLQTALGICRMGFLQSAHMAYNYKYERDKYEHFNR